MTRRLSQLIKMLMSRQRHPAHAPIVPIAPYSRSAAPGAAEAGPVFAFSEQTQSEAEPVRRPGGIRRAAPGASRCASRERPPRGTGRRPAEIGSGGVLILPRVLFHEWINDGQARWPVDEQRCGSAGKAGSPAAGAVGSGECSRTPPRPPSLNGNNYPGGD